MAIDGEISRNFHLTTRQFLFISSYGHHYTDREQKGFLRAPRPLRGVRGKITSKHMSDPRSSAVTQPERRKEGIHSITERGG